jgi:hypothetical protein
MKHNTHHLSGFVDFFNRHFGLDQFSIGIYRPLSYTDQHFSLKADREEQIVRAINELSEVALASPIRVQVECEFGDKLQALLAASSLGLEGWPLAEHTRTFDNGLTLVVRAMRTPVGLWRAVRVTAEGLWLAAEDLVESKRYAAMAVASLRDYEFDAVQLHAAGIRHPRFQELVGMPGDAFLQQVRLAS